MISQATIHTMTTESRSWTRRETGEETIEKIESYLDGEMGEIPFAKRDTIGRTVDYAAGRNRYIGYLISWQHGLSKICG